MDNFYTSPHLAQFLLENNTTLVGTVRPNRQDFSADLATADIGRGELIFALSDSGMLAVKYRAAQDNNEIEKCWIVKSMEEEQVLNGENQYRFPANTGDSDSPLKAICQLCLLLFSF